MGYWCLRPGRNCGTPGGACGALQADWGLNGAAAAKAGPLLDSSAGARLVMFGRGLAAAKVGRGKGGGRLLSMPALRPTGGRGTRRRPLLPERSAVGTSVEVSGAATNGRARSLDTSDKDDHAASTPVSTSGRMIYKLDSVFLEGETFKTRCLGP